MATGTDPDLGNKVRKTTEKISENLHIVANEPSMAFFRIQEHVRKVLPPIIEKKSEVLKLQSELNGHCYDMEYAVNAIKDIEKADKTFRSIEESLKTAIFLKQQLKYEETRNKSRSRDKDTSQNSVYKRFSAHITLDLPEIPDIISQTGNRVESMMRPTSTSNEQLQRSHTTLH